MPSRKKGGYSRYVAIVVMFDDGLEDSEPSPRLGHGLCCD